ncbi:hypothetical protein HF313_14965 [Massilia atriviolacea]|uniref:Uncharacterized protein n=1 Tax=Massilia atriviolacea TaxID=2495579 RepID=A0A430HR78_9BURK|nr:hypothetical protein [Massilia atriviolacea]RSZ60013.1 hypothetical protein EJB06_07490 [Massilia atriviolacea]
MNEQKLQSGWKLVPVEPTDDMLAAKPKSAGVQGQSVQSMQRNADIAKYRAMLAAAPSAPSWSSCTAPGPDGYQRTVQVPGMPGAARDAALEEIAVLMDGKDDGVWANTCGPLILARKSIAAPAPVQQAACGLSAAEVHHAERINVMHHNVVGVFAAIKAEHSAPVQQAAPSDYTDGLRTGLMQGATIARQLFVQHCHHHGVEGLLKRCEEAEQKLIEAARTAAPAQPAIPAQQKSIDTPEFRKLLRQIGNWHSGYTTDEIIAKVIQHVDAAILAAKEAP